ncbi:MAG TPA: sodium:proton antiporter [Sulfurimonas autotrophica]|nr:sodium:proton antiporter [Sulfurimonas autotrophica]
MTRFFVVIVVSLLFIGVSYAILSLPQQAQGLSQAVYTEMGKSGVSNPVTAVLMNFRAYDTLLEMAVLFVALIGVYSLSYIKKEANLRLQSSVLQRLGGILVPFLLLLSVYLLWVGAHASGGAFQAGSMVSASAILMFLSGWKFSLFPQHTFVRLLLSLSLIVFLFIAILTLYMSKELLLLPVKEASYFIFILEAAATVSIGITLFNLFVAIFSQQKEKK